MRGENVIQINGGILANVDVSVKNIIYVNIIHHVWNPATCSYENGKYLASIIDDPVITSDEIIKEETKTATRNFNEKMQSVKHKVSMFYLPFY